VKGHDAPYQSTGIGEFDRVLSGGFVRGSLTLLGGNPGIGKSTLVLQVAAAVAQRGTVVYLSGEESKEQLKLRYDRLGLNAPALQVCSETDVDRVVATIEHAKPILAVVDSVQTLFTHDAPAVSGGVTQINACTVRLLECAKTTGTAIVLIGHVTKEGFVAGPKTLEHLVDTVVYLEGEGLQAFRLLRTEKHRYGVTDEVGVFAMTDRGLAPVENPSTLFLLEGRHHTPGVAITVVLEGTRPFVVEVQALVSPTTMGYPRRLAIGFDRGRLELLCAVLAKRAGLPLAAQDVHVSVVGGLKVKEPAIDFAVCCAIASGFQDAPLDTRCVVIGEVGLGGEIRPVARMEQRLREATKLGFRHAAIAEHSLNMTKDSSRIRITLQTFSSIKDALARLLPKKRGARSSDAPPG
jgi:DNA repair protein RadA/Sms